jgi:hypothetical protein
MSSPLLYQDPPLDAGISSSAKSAVAFLFFPDFVPPPRSRFGSSIRLVTPIAFIGFGPARRR